MFHFASEAALKIRLCVGIFIFVHRLHIPFSWKERVKCHLSMIHLPELNVPVSQLRIPNLQKQ